MMLRLGISESGVLAAAVRIRIEEMSTPLVWGIGGRKRRDGEIQEED